mmetsp:Transcript_64813/g.120603  ORF Transcript_64813/g.120603 Transcript_64813/m.120603 type:complete len:733 (-) Transcript_64813:108-2306(-)
MTADCKEAQALKRIFKEWDHEGTGSIDRQRLSAVLQALSAQNGGATNFKPDDLLASIPDSKGVRVSYNAFVDYLFQSRDAADPGKPGELPRFVLVREASHEDTGWGLRNLQRVIATVRDGGLPHASTPQAALKVFLASAEGKSLASETQENMGRVLQAAESLGLFAEQGAKTIEEASMSTDYQNMFLLLQSDGVAWDKFARFCAEWLLLKAFEFFDARGEKRLSAQELMNFLMLLSVQKEEGFSLEPSDAEHIVQEFDVCGDGCLREAEFIDMVHNLRDEGKRMEPLAKPHLVLNFDVNNTILVSDSLTASGALELIAMTLAGCAWGMKTRHKCGREVWVLVSPKPSPLPPWEGLMSYTEFIVEQCPMPQQEDREEVKRVKAWRRQALQNFCEPGQPGETFRAHRDRLYSMLPNKEHRLLPCFYHTLRELKREGRSFSLLLRTFGVDVTSSVQDEFNAFCEGRHPDFVGEPLLDGSDGGGDYRMDLNDPESIGTFFRDPKTDVLALVWGTHQQPEPEQGLEFFSTIPGTKVVLGAKAAAEALEERLNARRGMVVIRDYYPAWAGCKCKGEGGKPVFLHVEDEEVLPVFFDDHIRPADPNIVDVIDVRTYPTRVPMAQVYDTHLVKAVPLHAIADQQYFLKELRKCEKLKAEQVQRRRKVARMLHDVGAIRGVIRLLSGTEDFGHLTEPPDTGLFSRQPSTQLDPSHSVEAMKYTPWQQTEVVKHAAPFVGIS